MIHWATSTALNSGLFDRVIVSTDDSEIAEISRQSGAEVPFMRPEAVSDDHATLRDVIRHAITTLEQDGPSISALCCIYATACFMIPDDLRQGWQSLQNSGAEYAFAACPYPHPIQRAFLLGARGEVIVADPRAMATRTQDLEEHYFDAGMFFWGWRDAFFTDVRIYSDVGRIVQIPSARVHDIDTMEDWHKAELAWNVMRANEQ